VSTAATGSATSRLPERRLDLFRWSFTAVVVVVVLWSFLGLEVKWSRLLEAPADMWNLARLMFTNMEASAFPDLARAMWESISIAWVGTLIAAIVAVPLSFLAAENLVGRPIAWVTRQVFNLLRAIPEVILALAFIPIFGLTPMAGVMAIGIGSIGTLGKLFYEVHEGIRTGPLEVTPELSSFILYRFEVNIRASAVMGLVGAGGIGSDLALALQFKQYGDAGLGLIIVVVGTLAVDFVSGIVRRRIVAGRTAATDAEIDRDVDAALLA
jgi:phosphonate transport system permease protein